MLASYTFWLACPMPDIGDSWTDRHKWSNRQNRSHSVHVQLFYRVVKMSSQVHSFAQIMCRKYQQISANFSNCNGVYFQKNIIPKTGECVLKKRTLPQLLFYIPTLISSKLPVHLLIRRDFSFWAFPFIDQERCFLFLWLFRMKEK